jgi:ATP dependent DNA ligase domain
MRVSAFIQPCPPSPAECPPSGPGWVHELKHDGFRMMVRRDSAGIRLITRNGHDWSDRFLLVAQAAVALQVRSFLLDGEGAACDGDGMPVFDRLRCWRVERLISVVEDAGRNLVECSRKADKRDDGKDANPIREAHGLRLVIAALSARGCAQRVRSKSFKSSYSQNTPTTKQKVMPSRILGELGRPSAVMP